MKLLKNLDRILAPGGVILFADEPLVPVESPTVPYPWGMRLDGISLYYTRTWGWLEMGFTRAYFKEALARVGWEARYVPSTIEGVGDLAIARRQGGR